MEDELPKRPWYWIPTAYFIIGAAVVSIFLAFASDDNSGLNFVIGIVLSVLLFPSGLLSLYMHVALLHAGTLAPARQSLDGALIVNTIALLIFMKWRDNQV